MLPSNFLAHLISPVLLSMFISSGAEVIDVKYAPIASVDASWIGTEIRMDFKSSDAKNGEWYESNDQYKLKLGEENIIFTENWNTSEQNELANQLLETDSEWVIREQFLQVVSKEYILVKVKAYRRQDGELVFGAEEQFKISKNDLQGVLYSEK